jgi:hypothetical protein
MSKNDVYTLKTISEEEGPVFLIVPKANLEAEPKEKWRNPVTAQRRLLYWNALDKAND